MIGFARILVRLWIRDADFRSLVFLAYVLSTKSFATNFMSITKLLCSPSLRTQAAFFLRAG
jgi:hypothetical protein